MQEKGGGRKTWSRKGRLGPDSKATEGLLCGPVVMNPPSSAAGGIQTPVGELRSKKPKHKTEEIF